MLSEKISPMNSSAPILPKRRVAVCFGLPRAVPGCTCPCDMNEVCSLSLSSHLVIYLQLPDLGSSFHP